MFPQRSEHECCANVRPYLRRAMTDRVARANAPDEAVVNRGVRLDCIASTA